MTDYLKYNTCSSVLLQRGELQITMVVAAAATAGIIVVFKRLQPSEMFGNINVV